MNDGESMNIKLRLYHVDAFTAAVFAGNPAAVVPPKAGWRTRPCKPSPPRTTFR
jgi:hypothetical protein